MGSSLSVDLDSNKTGKGILTNTDKNAFSPIVNINISDAIAQSSFSGSLGNHYGVAFINNEFWISKRNTDTLITLSRQGVVTGIFTISGVTNLSNITTDGTSLFMGNFGFKIYVVNPILKQLDSVIITNESTNMLTYDADADNSNGGFWVGGNSSSLSLLNKNGIVIRSISQSIHRVINASGLALDKTSTDGPYFGVFNQGNAPGNSKVRLELVEVANGSNTSQIYFPLSDLNQNAALGTNPISAGLFSTNQFNSSPLQIFGIINGDKDILFGYDFVASRCSTPTNIGGRYISAQNGVVLNWSPSRVRQLEYGPIGFLPGNGTVVNYPNSPFTLRGLVYGNYYEYRVNFNCGFQKNSFWSETKKFRFYPDTAVNDFCEKATLLSVNNSCIYEVGSVGYNQSGPGTICNGFIGSPNDDSWYKFVVTAPNITIQVQPDNLYDGIIDVYSGSNCSSLVNVGCSDSTTIGLLEIYNLYNQNIGDTLFFRVYNYKSFREGNYDVCVLENITVGLNENQLNNLIIFPNPTKDWINISGVSNDVNSIELIDYTGKILLKTSKNTNRLDVSEFKPGLYFLKVITTGKYFTEKVILR
jgi:hypothetical protein